MNGQWLSIKMRLSLRMCSCWPLLRISFFLRTLMAKRHLMLLFSCTLQTWRSIDYIIETWNLKEAAAQGVCVNVCELLWDQPLPGLRDQTPQLLDCKLSGNHLSWKMRGVQDPCLTCSQGKQRWAYIFFYRRKSHVVVVENSVVMLLTRFWSHGLAAPCDCSQIPTRQWCL